MKLSSLEWIRRRTTVDDLLDDGIENGSDLQREAGRDDKPHDARALAIRDATLERIRREHAQGAAAYRRRAISALGLLLGFVSGIAGTLLLLFPVDMLVHHSRIRYLPSVIEHVTMGRSRLYGASLLLAGIALCAYALYRPRGHER